MEEQISLAKELLQVSDLEKKEEAVRILIGISKQGNQEATTILTKCLEGREGVTPENEDEVKWCIKTSEEEKRLQHAVEEIYNSMKKDGEDKVALQDISEALKKAEEKLKVRLKNVARSIIFIACIYLHLFILEPQISGRRDSYMYIKRSDNCTSFRLTIKSRILISLRVLMTRYPIFSC